MILWLISIYHLFKLRLTIFSHNTTIFSRSLSDILSPLLFKFPTTLLSISTMEHNKITTLLTLTWTIVIFPFFHIYIFIYVVQYTAQWSIFYLLLLSKFCLHCMAGLQHWFVWVLIYTQKSVLCMYIVYIGCNHSLCYGSI